MPGDPAEHIHQPRLASALTDALGEHGYIQPNMLFGSNLALTAIINKQEMVKAPDWFYVPHVYSTPAEAIRSSYTPHLEGGPVAIVMEFLSADDCGELSIRPIPPYGKLYFYEQILQVPTYVTYDPYNPGLQVRRLKSDRYVLQEADANGRFYIPKLQLNLGLWKEDRLGKNTHWLRWWDEAGNLLLWSSEQAQAERQRAETERQRAEILAAKLKELGVDPDKLT